MWTRWKTAITENAVQAVEGSGCESVRLLPCDPQLRENVRAGANLASAKTAQSIRPTGAQLLN